MSTVPTAIALAGVFMRTLRCILIAVLALAQAGAIRHLWTQHGSLDRLRAGSGADPAMQELYTSASSTHAACCGFTTFEQLITGLANFNPQCSRTFVHSELM